jgi:hypothetical protein
MKIEKKVVGKRFSRVEQTSFVSEESDTPEQEGKVRKEFFQSIGKTDFNKTVIGESFTKRLEKIICSTKEQIKKELDKHDSIGRDAEVDSNLDLLEKIKMSALIAKNESNSIEGRLEHSFNLGKSMQLLKVYENEHIEKSKNGSGPKNWPELDDWLRAKLQDETNWTVAALWAALPEDEHGDIDSFYVNNNNKLEYLGNFGSRKCISETSFPKYVRAFKKRQNI